jgi:hypothetical protein
MKEIIDEITKLSDEWYHLIGKDHHKDRDCHWYIETRWSYGYEPKFVVLHHGYILDRIEEEYDTYEEALNMLKTLLSESVEREKDEQQQEEDLF